MKVSIGVVRADAHLRRFDRLSDSLPWCKCLDICIVIYVIIRILHMVDAVSKSYIHRTENTEKSSRKKL